MSLRFNLTITISLSLLSFLLLNSCKKDGTDSFLKRNLEELRFSYTESSKDFTVRATGEWAIDIPAEYSWIKVSPQQGVGDGHTYQKVTVTCERNSGDLREGTIYLNGSGQSDVAIKVYQTDGLFEWTTFSNGSYLDLENPIIVNSSSNAVIKIPYIKAVGNESFPLQVTLTGKGAAGLSVSATTANLTSEGDGFLTIPISGTTSTQGEVNINVKIDGQDFGTLNTIAATNNVLITQNFSKFLWGGDCIANKDGVSTVKPTAEMTLADETALCTVGTNGANGSGVTSTIRNSNPNFYTEIGMDGWYGVRNYMRPGYIQLGAASATAKEYGSIITPALNLPAGQYDLLVKFKAAIYNQPAPANFTVGLVPKNTDGIKIDNYNTVTNKVSIPFNIAAMKWADFTCVIKNATDGYCLTIALPAELNQGGAVQASRMYIDDINISY